LFLLIIEGGAETLLILSLIEIIEIHAGIEIKIKLINHQNAVLMNF